MTDMKLGRRAPKRAPRLKLRNFLNAGGIPFAVPPKIDYLPAVTDWDLYENDRFGVCGPAALANYLKLVTAVLGSGEFRATQAEVYDLYRRSGNPTFDPQTGAGDDGVDMQTMLEALHAGGIGPRDEYKPIAFAAVDVTNREEVKAAVAIFGGVLLGCNMQTVQQTQASWDYVVGAPEWGGHAVFAGAYDDDGLGIVSWGSAYDTTENFLQHRLMEAWVCIFPEHLGSRAFLEGVDLNELADAYHVLTGKDFPAASRPADDVPAAGSDSGADRGPDEADRKMADAVRVWATKHHHTGAARPVGEAIREWLTAKGL